MGGGRWELVGGAWRRGRGPMISVLDQLRLALSILLIWDDFGPSMFPYCSPACDSSVERRAFRHQSTVTSNCRDQSSSLLAKHRIHRWSAERVREILTPQPLPISTWGRRSYE